MKHLAALLILLILCVYPLSQPAAAADKYHVNDKTGNKILYDDKEAKQISALVAYGWEAFNDNEFQDAEFFFKKALELSPGRPDALYGLSWTYFKTGNDPSAIEGFETLFDKGYRKVECGQALFYLYLRNGQREKAKRYLAYLSKEDQKKYKSHGTKKKGTKKGGTKKKNLYQMAQRPKKAGSTKALDQFFELAKKNEWQDLTRAFNRLSPSLKNRKDVLLVAGWAFYNTANTEKARKIFKDLLKTDSSNQEAAYGLALSCQKLHDETCLASLYKLFPNDKRIKNLYCNHLRRLISDQYLSGLHQKALGTFRLFDSASCPDKTGKITELAAWAAFKGQDYQLSSQLFERLAENGRASSSVYHGLFASYQHMGNEEGAWNLAENLSRSHIPQNRKLAADFYYSKDLAARAARVLGQDSAIYSNTDAPAVEAGYEYTYLDGDKGTSRLRSQELPLVKIDFMPWNKLGLSLGLTNLLLQSGSAGAYPWIGTPLLGTQKSSAKSSVNAIIPHITFDLQDRWRITGHLSTSPIGGQISPIPLFDMTFQKAGHKTRWSIFQRSITRSILSWTGQHDPYTGKDWGRVTETGLSASTSFDLSKDWWLSLKGEYGHLWGKDTWHNTKLLTSLSVGNSFKNTFLSQGSYGIFTTVMHFDRNTNFYTFGHGGYFSPQFFVATGPFCHVTTKQGNRWLLDASLSVAYLDFYEKGSSIYPLSDKLPGSYSGDHSSKIGFSVKFSSGYLLTPHIIGKLRFAVDRSGDYTQYQIGAFLTFFLRPRNGVLNIDLANKFDFFFGD